MPKTVGSTRASFICLQKSRSSPALISLRNNTCQGPAQHGSWTHPMSQPRHALSSHIQ